MEIVIENPVESSSPPPPPPPPPPQAPPQAPTSTWNVSSASTCASTPAVMAITIAENPTAPTYPPPVRFSYRANSFHGDPYSARRPQPLTRPYDDPDGASPSVRRIDKSGLLGITDPDASALRIGSRSPRFLSAMNSAPSGIVSPRRFECIGQLDPVPEVPGHVNRANVTPGSPNVFNPASTNLPGDSTTSMLGQDRGDVSQLDSCGRNLRLASFNPLESRYRHDHGQTVHAYERHLEGIESSNPEATDHGSSFRFQEGCDIKGRTLGRSFALTRNNALENVPRYSETCYNFPFAVRTPTMMFPGFEETSGSPSNRATTTTSTTSTTTVAVSTMREMDARKQEDEVSDCLPEEERAEAEGCEHGSTNDPLKDGESSERGDEMADNDGIQTLRVIILSEQL